MFGNNKNNSRNGRSHPSIRTEDFHVRNVVTPDTKEAQEKLLAEEERQKARERIRAKTAKNMEKQKAKILGHSLRSKNEKDFNINGSFFGNLSGSFKRKFLIISIAIIVVIIGICVGVFAFMASTAGRLSISEEAKSKLVRVQENQPYYMLFSADIDNDSNHSPDILMLTRVSPTDKSFILIQIPIDTYVASAAGGGTTLNKIYQEHGDAALIESVAAFSEIGISHYVYSNADGIKNLVDSFGGIDVNLQEYVDDPSAGDVYIPQGNSHINGEETLVLLKAKNFREGSTVIASNQREVCCALLKAALFDKNINMPLLIDKVAGEIQTDMDPGILIHFVDHYSTTNPEDIQSTEIPGYKTVRNSLNVFMIDATSWKNLRTQITYGIVPTSSTEYTIADIDPSSFTILVQNGAGITGAASTLADNLKNMGFNVIGSQNAESNIYVETLIIYNGESMKKNAQVVCNLINNGRLVDGDGLYNMTSDILIIIGYDFKI